MLTTLNIIEETYREENLGRCYNRYYYTVVVEGKHDENTMREFGEYYVSKNRRGQSNYYDGFKNRTDGNTEFYTVHTVDSSD
jgi:hypothetical protein